jgi:predicted GIY-YIG superfamily endonuclease
MSFVYILQSASTEKFYVGSTDHLERRVQEHQRGKNVPTGLPFSYYPIEFPDILQ